MAGSAGGEAGLAHLRQGHKAGWAIGKALEVVEVEAGAAGAVSSRDGASGAVWGAGHSNSRNVDETSGHVVEATLLMQDVAKVAG